MSALERLLLLAHELPWPGAWVWLQLAAAGGASACFWARSRQRPELRRAFLFALPLSVLGALLVGMAFRLPHATSLVHPDLLGVSSYGALLGMVAGFLWFSRRSSTEGPNARLVLLAPSLLLLVAIGRLGCFAAGCEPGRVTAATWAVRFPRGSATFREHLARGWVLPSDRWSLAVHPVQLYEATLALTLLALAYALERRAMRPPVLVASITLGYVASRVAVDFLRA